jgi:predicted metal-dependent hydrolase
MKKDARRHSFRRPEMLGEPVSAQSFKDEVRAWADRLDVEPVEIHITGMKRKWASCSTRGRVTFDTGLLALPEPFRREVIVHELLHLKVPNHGPLFRALLDTHLSGDPATSRREA